MIWWAITCSSELLAAVGAAGAELAGRAALTRRAAFRDPLDGDDHVAARVLTRLLLARAHAGSPGSAAAEWRIEQHCDEPNCRRAEEHGRPTARLSDSGAGVAVSWSHARGLLACAVGIGVDRVGIDAEQPRQSTPLPTLSWRAWVRAEALVKAGFIDLDRATQLGPVLDAPAARDGLPVSALLGAGAAPGRLLDIVEQQAHEPHATAVHAAESAVPPVPVRAALAWAGPESVQLAGPVTLSELARVTA